MWNSFRTDARDGLTAEVITYPGGHGDEIHAYVARPAGDEPAPGIVAVHHLPGAYEFHRYDGAGHAFFYYMAPMYRPEAAMDGWAKVFGFFGRHLSG